MAETCAEPIDRPDVTEGGEISADAILVMLCELFCLKGIKLNGLFAEWFSGMMTCILGFVSLLFSCSPLGASFGVPSDVFGLAASDGRFGAGDDRFDVDAFSCPQETSPFRQTPK